MKIVRNLIYFKTNNFKSKHFTPLITKFLILYSILILAIKNYFLFTLIINFILPFSIILIKYSSLLNLIIIFDYLIKLFNYLTKVILFYLNDL